MRQASAGGSRRRRRGQETTQDDFLPPCCDPEAKEVRCITPEKCETVRVATRAEQNEVLKCFLAKDEFNSREERLWIRRRVNSEKKYGCVSFLLYSAETGTSSLSSSPPKRTPQGAVTVRINTCPALHEDDDKTRWCQVMNTAVWVPRKRLGTRMWQDVEERLRNDHKIDIAVLYPVSGAQKFWLSRGFRQIDLLPNDASESLIPEVDFDGNELPLWQKKLLGPQFPEPSLGRLGIAGEIEGEDTRSRASSSSKPSGALGLEGSDELYNESNSELETLPGTLQKSKSARPRNPSWLCSQDQDTSGESGNSISTTASSGSHTGSGSLDISTMSLQRANGTKRRHTSAQAVPGLKGLQIDEGEINGSAKRPRSAEQNARYKSSELLRKPFVQPQSVGFPRRFTVGHWHGVQRTEFSGYPPLPSGWIYVRSSSTGRIYCHHISGQYKSMPPEQLLKGDQLTPDLFPLKALSRY